jgi:hypothetical protein
MALLKRLSMDTRHIMRAKLAIAFFGNGAKVDELRCHAILGAQHFYLPFSPLSSKEFMQEMKKKYHSEGFFREAAPDTPFFREGLFFLLPG